MKKGEELNISKQGEERLRALIKEQEDKYQECVRELAFHGQEQDGWHGEMYGITYEHLLKEQSALDEIRGILTNHELVESIKGVVSVGSVVDLLVNQNKKRFFIDGYIYKNKTQILTPNSPIGKAIYGKKEKYKTIVIVGDKEYEVEIVGIESSSVS